jgi:hypothetical protein
MNEECNCMNFYAKIHWIFVGAFCSKNRKKFGMVDFCMAKSEKTRRQPVFCLYKMQSFDGIVNKKQENVLTKRLKCDRMA